MNVLVHSFDIHSEGFFTPAIRSRIVHFILDRQRFTEDQDDDFAFGIERLISELVYTAAYPLHDVSNHSMCSFYVVLVSFMFYTGQWLKSLQSLSPHNLSSLISSLLSMFSRTWLKHLILGHPIVLFPVTFKKTCICIKTSLKFILCMPTTRNLLHF